MELVPQHVFQKWQRAKSFLIFHITQNLDVNNLNKYHEFKSFLEMRALLESLHQRRDIGFTVMNKAMVTCAFNITIILK